MSNDFFSSEEIQFLKNLAGQASLNFELHETWGSKSNPSHREEIKNSIHNLKAANSQINNVIFTSTSHTNGMGGYASIFDEQNIQLGFDIEEIHRTKPELVDRICEFPNEFKSAPSPAHLWAAKEAGFKALIGPTQPQVVTSLNIGNWRLVRLESENLVSSPQPLSKIYTYELLNLGNFEFTNGFGFSLLKSKYVISCFFAKKCDSK